MKAVVRVLEAVVVLSKKLLENFALALPNTEKSFPFDKTTAVFKVCNKMFFLIDEPEALSFNVKCDPTYAMELRSIYKDVTPGYHMNKKHWNTVKVNGDIDQETLFEFIKDSYDLIVSKLTKKQELLLKA